MATLGHAVQAFETRSQSRCRISQMLSLRKGSQNSPSQLPSRLHASSSRRTGSRSGAGEFHSSWQVVQGVACSLPFAPDRKKEELNCMRNASAFVHAGFAPGGSSGNSRHCRMALVSSTSLPKRTSSRPRASERFVSPSSSGQAFEALRAWPNPLLKPTRNGIRQSAGKVRCTQSTSPAACRMPSRAV
jgi:hypothetical protein